MTVGLERLSEQLSGGKYSAEEIGRLLELWEDILTLAVDRESTSLHDSEAATRALTHLLERAEVSREEFWKLSRSRRSRLLISRFSRTSRAIPRLEISAFDIEKVIKERFRREPLTMGSAWHYGLWRSYFSHAAITHPANDGLREEFSTAWDILRKQPAIVWRDSHGRHIASPKRVRLDLPILVGPLPHSDGHSLELAYLRAIESADPDRDLKTRSLLVVRASDFLENARVLGSYANHLIPRFRAEDLERLWNEEPETEPWRDLLAATRVAELRWHPKLKENAARILERWPQLILSVSLRYSGGFWAALAESVAVPEVAMVQVHSGELKSYDLIPRVDTFLKNRLERARVQLVNVGGDTDTISSAAAVYESILLGANAGAITDMASIALAPELVDVYHGAPAEPLIASYASREPNALMAQAVDTLTCWQHSILDFLSSMGIDDVQKTSGNTMAITMTTEWARQAEALITPEFAEQNRELNRIRLEEEPVPPTVRDRYRVSYLIGQLSSPLELPAAAKIQAQQTVNWHLENLNQSLTGDYLNVAYRMGSGRLPEVEDFFLEGDMGPCSLDGVRLRVSRESVAWSLRRFSRDPALLDYVQLAIPRGFQRPGSVQPLSRCQLRTVDDRAGREPLAEFSADRTGGFELRLTDSHVLEGIVMGDAPIEVVAERNDHSDSDVIVLKKGGANGFGVSIERASEDGRVILKRHPAGGFMLTGVGVRHPIWHGPVSHASISLGAASEDFLVARLEGNSGLTLTSSGEGGPIRLESDEDMMWESLQAASGHFGIEASDLRRVRDVEIKINQGAKPGKGGRLAGAKVTAQVSRARNIPIHTDALSPDPKHDIYSIEDMPAEVWLWLLYHNHCGIKITGSNYTQYVAAGMWSNFIVDYLLIDAGLGGSGNYHADSSHVGWPDIFRTILHTHHALLNERVDLENTGELRTIRDANGAPLGATGGTRLFASGGIRDEVDMIKVLCAGADGLVTASIDKAVGFGCNQCGYCYLDCPRGGITTKPELTEQNDRDVMRTRFRNWGVLNLVKLAVLIDALNYENGVFDERGTIVDGQEMIDDIRLLRGRVDLLEIPGAAAERKETPVTTETQEFPEQTEPAAERVRELDSCRVASLVVTEPVDVGAVWEAARVSKHGGNNRGGGIDFAGFVPAHLADKTYVILNTIGPDREETIGEMLEHFAGCRFYDLSGKEISTDHVRARLPDFRVPVREKYADEYGWRRAGLRENVGDFHSFFVDIDPQVLGRYARTLLESKHWLQRKTCFGHRSTDELVDAVYRAEAGGLPADTEDANFMRAVREEYFSVLSHILDSRYYRTHGKPDAPENKYASYRRGYVVSIGEDLGAIKISGWTHVIPEYFDLEQYWVKYPGAGDMGGIEITVRGKTLKTMGLYAHVWGMHHRYPTNSPAIDEQGRGNPAGAHPFKAYNLLLMHNGEQVGVDSTAPFLAEYGFVHTDSSFGPGSDCYHGDSIYERKALTDTEYAAYLVDFTRRILGLDTEEASQIISPITGLDFANTEEPTRSLYERLATNYVQLTPTGPYKFTIVESRPGPQGERRVGFRENMDIKFLRPHEIIVQVDESPGGVQVTANGSEGRIADTMIRVLHQQGILSDSGSDLRFNMRPGGRKGQDEFGGVVEVFLEPGSKSIELNNRFGERVEIRRAGQKPHRTISVSELAKQGETGDWRTHIHGALIEAVAAAREEETRLSSQNSRLYGPESSLPQPADDLVGATLERVRALPYDDYRYLTEVALPNLAAQGDVERALAIRILTELRKRLLFHDLGGKSLSSLEYFTDGGRAADGSAEGGLYRILDAVPSFHENYQKSRYLRITFETRNDIVEPAEPLRDILVVDARGFESEGFDNRCASRFISQAVRYGWRNLVLYDFVGGPRYIGTNLAWTGGEPARGVEIELYGREFGDFLAVLLEGARVYVYGQGQSHAGMKADSGRLFILQDALNTCAYSAHGMTYSAWDSGSRFAVAGQNKVFLRDGISPAPGFKSIHFGSPNEYAFEYLMSGGDNSVHIVLGLAKPDEKGELYFRPRPYAGKFLMSGAAAGRVFLLDPQRTLDPRQYHGNVAAPIAREEWERDVAPLINAEAWIRGAPVRADADSFSVRIAGEWKKWGYNEAFTKLIPMKVAMALVEQGIAPPGLQQIVGE